MPADLILWTVLGLLLVLYLAAAGFLIDYERSWAGSSPSRALVAARLAEAEALDVIARAAILQAGR